MAGLKRRSTRQAAVRKRSIYAEPDTDDDFEVDSEADYEPEPDVEETAPPPKKRKVTTRHKPQTRSRAKSKPANKTVRSVFKIGKPRKANSSKDVAASKKEFAGPSDHRIPKWASLPVDILRDIFIFASYPLHEGTTESGNNVSWLIKSALTCRAFALPALEAYYQSPAMLTSLHPHHLLDLLRMPKDKRWVDYSVKIKTLSIDVRRLAYVAHNKPSFDLCPLVAELPQLQHMEILHPMYLPPYRPFKIQRWTFPATELFQTMERHDIRLKSWRWSRDMIPKNAFLDLYGMMTTAHQSKVFSRLDRLVVCGFNYEDSSEPKAPEGSDGIYCKLYDLDNANPATEAIATPPGLATSIQKLPAIQDLTFISCDIIMEKFLQRLPQNLQRLELSNCLEITSDMMRAFFNTSGAQLKELVLNHNAALNLSFLQALKVSCPRLEVLKVDLHYYSERFTINDATALYDELLPEDEVPTWPSTLRHLEIVHAQKWSPESAQNLFRSLIDSAPELLDLRSLVLQAHINIPWRDRVGFRDQWIERLRRVYLRREIEPAKNLGSIRQYKLWKQAQGLDNVESMDELGHDNQADAARITRTMSHVQVSTHKSSGDTEAYSDSDVPPAAAHGQPRRSKRVAETQVSQASKSNSPSPESDEESESEEEEWRKQPEKFIQGLCQLVDIRIDNQRPRENQWTEGDFLDSEVSGDEDWQEGAEFEEETYAW
ncbi:hypothetical protein M409DRAFT_65641 [Zasmidium cellare ATCC 36951]|uniref:Uncharacterized protein n=1 Tax=Zasmidium cellare ATCC 36951 TaxID=1080233 RepID=A0A6A6CLJ3_ZASCE|nr:uncharacterized protein M409DRAFT_65641 [Zasmidium cellare ATCC 36951]KAF2168127.1 hypothetical protein M409DRAFT_65641 [Zasmidium cellare ATCC 36951]